MQYACKKNANHFSGEKVNYKELISFNDCCKQVGVILKNMLEFPEKLKFLLDGSHTKSSSFRQHIPVYNNLFSFASLMPILLTSLVGDLTLIVLKYCTRTNLLSNKYCIVSRRR